MKAVKKIENPSEKNIFSSKKSDKIIEKDDFYQENNKNKNFRTLRQKYQKITEESRENLQSWRKQLFFSSIGVAFVLAFSVVGIFRNISVDSNALLASVNTITQSKNYQFSADIALINLKKSLHLVTGKLMESVTQFEGIIAINPNLGVKLQNSAENTRLEELSPGLYRVIIDLGGKDIAPFSTIAELEMLGDLGGHPVTFTDTQFISGNNRYNLTNVVQD